MREYAEVVEQLKGLTNAQVIPVGEKESQVIKHFESLIENPKVYS